ncbi:MAG: fumarate hydratase, partial [bacterium]
MKEIAASTIREAVKKLCIEANLNLPEDVHHCLVEACEREDFPQARTILNILKENAAIAASTGLPICQDTGMACVFVEIGQDVHVTGDLTQAIHDGVRDGYEEGYLRKSVVSDPAIDRINTKDNTPAVIHYEIVPGDALKITVAPKGFGSENMSQVKMLKPSDGIEGVKDFILKVVEDAGPNPCPPLVIGVGIGSTFDGVTLLA